MKIVILAGGKGTRLWPISTSDNPKQFIKIKQLDYVSFFQTTFLRANKISKLENIYVVTLNDYYNTAVSQISELGYKVLEGNIITEKASNNTLSAILSGIERFSDNEDVLILPSDHVIENDLKFIDIINGSLYKTCDGILIFGIKPTNPHTGYGYIDFDNKGIMPYKVNRFKEKPDRQNASTYIKEGFYWNSGIFLFNKGFFLNEIKTVNPDFYTKYISSSDNLELPSISIDYGVLELSNNIYVSLVDTFWSDLGTFSSLFDYLIDKNLCIDKSGNYIISTNEKYAENIGVSNSYIVITDSNFIISDRENINNICKK